MISAQKHQWPEFKLQPVVAGELHRLKAELTVRQSTDKKNVVDDITLVSMCQKIPPESWRKIPVVFDQQIATVFWKAVGNGQPLCVDTAFAEWFIRTRASQETAISQALVNSLLSEWPDEITGFSELICLLETFLPKGVRWPNSAWQKETVHNVFAGRSTVSIAVNSLGDDVGFGDAIQKLLWKQLIKQYAAISVDHYESQYFGLKAIVETGFVNGREKWPELNIDCLNQITPAINIIHDYCTEFHGIAVGIFDRMDNQGRSKLDPFVLSAFEIWSANKFADRFERFNKMDKKRKLVQVEKLKLAARAGHAKANRVLGRLLLENAPGSSDWQRGIEHMEIAANGQDQEAQTQLCILYHSGQGNMLAGDKIVKWEITALRQGDGALIHKVRESAEAGNPNAQFAISMHCMNASKYDEGIEWLRKATAQNHQEAMFRMAMMLMSGDRIALNREEALRLLKKLVAFSDVDALHHLALCYRLGVNMPENLDLAISLYRKAAERGSASAAFILGSFYVDGAVLPKSSELARYFLCKAAMAGHAGAEKLLYWLINSEAESAPVVEAT